MKRVLLTAIAICGLAGCTSQATRDAILTYQKTEHDKQQLLNEATRQSEQFLFLGLSQYIDANKHDPQKIKAAVRAAWEARSGIEKIRLQFTLQRAMTAVTLGQYLYDQQGWMNAILDTTSKDLELLSQGVDAGDQDAHITSPSELVKSPSTQP